MEWDRACELSKSGIAVRTSTEPWPVPTLVRRFSGGGGGCYNRNTSGDAGEWSTCPFAHVYDHNDWQPVNPRDAVTALGAVVADDP